MIRLDPIGIVHTPYIDIAPSRPDCAAQGEFYLEIFEKFMPGLKDLETFSHLVILFHFDRTKKSHLTAHPPGYPGKEVGVFASRSPFRPSKIGMNIIKVLSVENNLIHTSPMDALNSTPLLDIKPYIPDTDCFPEANSGWLTTW
jgi:tRNA-Thr(GGU) m(6)t(6)A37 methyltransferase TsaA